MVVKKERKRKLGVRRSKVVGFEAGKDCAALSRGCEERTTSSTPTNTALVMHADDKSGSAMESGKNRRTLEL